MLPDSGAAHAFDALARRHQVALWRYLRALGVAAHAADELTQDTLVEAYRQGLQEQGPGTARWLRNAARHHWLRSLRRRQRRRETPIADAVDQLWDRVAGTDGTPVLEALAECRQELSERARAAVALSYGEGRSRAEIATALRMKGNGVKTLLQRARQTLRDCLQRRMP